MALQFTGRTGMSMQKFIKFIRRHGKAWLPYGFMVWWLKERYGTEIDHPFFYYRGLAKILRRAVKWSLPFCVVMRVRHPYFGAPSGQARDCLKWSECQAWGGADVVESFSEKVIDVIVPVYNGMQFLPRLFDSIGRTRMSFRLIVVNDCSPDTAVRPFLEAQKVMFKNCIIIDNDQNLGFVRSVNKALRLAENDVALVNTDVELPTGWLERLMRPILTSADVASATPFTNSGTICSFPNMLADNALFEGLSVEQIDDAFKGIKPRYQEVPTGVGFCMGMKHSAIAKVGLFDEEAFYRGYGEENDWCQRAIAAGYKNVIMENLFVYHKHGGSFTSEAKQKYLQRNGQILAKRYPNYDKDVAAFIALNPHKPLRAYLKCQICSRCAKASVVMFDHDWGGGANVYSDKVREGLLQNEYAVYRVVQSWSNDIVVEFSFHDQFVCVGLDSVDEILEVVKDVRVERVVVNELVAFKSIPKIMSVIKDVKCRHDAELTYCVHDFYAVCPSFYLLDDAGMHCGFATEARCAKCYAGNAFRNGFVSLPSSVREWRTWFRSFFRECDEIRFFSENTKKYYEFHYGLLPRSTVVPHTLGIPLRAPTIRHPLTIAVLGNVLYSKGSCIVKEMAGIAKDHRLPVRMVWIGDNSEQMKCGDITFAGKYRREDLPALMEGYAVSVVFVASIWPETFSYTTLEAMSMGLPVASFDIGAPADRIKQYDKGFIIPEISARAALLAIGAHFGYTFDIEFPKL